MSIGRRIPAWISISLILQLGVLSYLNFFFLGDSQAVSSETEVVYSSMAYRLPEGASNIKVSHDSTFAAYVHDGKLNFVNLKSKKRVYAMSFEGYTFSFYRWLPDRNRAFVIFKMPKGDATSFKVYAYDCDSNSEMEIQEINEKVRDCEVQDVQLSTLTNMIYIVFKSGDLPILYRIDIMGDKRKVYPRISRFSNMKLCTLKDIILYEDPKSGRIYVQDGSEAWNLPLKGKLALMGIDGDDNIYVAEVTDNKVSNVQYGKLNVESRKWKKIELGRDADRENVLVGYDGEIFIKEEDYGYLTRVSDNMKIVYDGEFVEMHERFVVSVNKNQIRIKPIDI